MNQRQPTRYSPVSVAVLHNIKFLAVGGLCVFLLLRGGLNSTALILAVIGALLFVLGVYRIARATQLPRDAPTGYDVSHLPRNDQVRHYRRLRLYSILILGSFALWTGYNLVLIRTGHGADADLWGPVAWIYEKLGFWPALVTIPALVAFLFYALSDIIRQKESHQGE